MADPTRAARSVGQRFTCRATGAPVFIGHELFEGTAMIRQGCIPFV